MPYMDPMSIDGGWNIHFHPFADPASDTATVDHEGLERSHISKTVLIMLRHKLVHKIYNIHIIGGGGGGGGGALK